MKDHLLPIPEVYDAKTQRMVAIFAAQLDAQHDKLKKTVEALTTEQLEWQLRPGMNTIGMLLAHIAVAEAFWVQVAPSAVGTREEWEIAIKGMIGIAGNEDGFPLPETGTHPETLAGKSLADYTSMLEKCREGTHRVLRTWKDEQLDSTYILEEKYSFTRSWTLYHVLEHLAGHLGQILLIKHIMRDEGILPKVTKEDQ